MLRVVLLISLLAACGDNTSSPGDRCYEFLSTYCVVMAECNPPGWSEECLVNADNHCSGFGGPLPDDPDACLELMRDASCAEWVPELTACWDTYVP